MEDSVRASTRSLKDLDISPSTWKSLAQTVHLGVAKSPLRQKTDGPFKHRGNVPPTRPEQPPPPLHHLQTHGPCVSEPSGL